MRARKSTVGLLFWVALANAASSITDEIAARRTVARNSYYNPEDEKPIHPGCGPNDKRSNFRRPRDEAGAGEPCPGQGVVVRRDMGSLGVSSFQQVAGAILADAIGPLFLYYDEWPEAAKVNALQPVCLAPSFLPSFLPHNPTYPRPYPRSSSARARCTMTTRLTS